MTEAVAAIDCGTHSTRLLIERDGEPIVRQVELTRLGDGMQPGGVVQLAALERVAETLATFKSLLDTHDVGDRRVVATSAVRDAVNGQVVVDRISDSIGATPEILDGRAEAELGFVGATAELDPATGPFLVIDIGGGSTEFAVGTTSCDAALSLDVGSVRLSGQYLDSDPPRPEELSACITVTGAWLDDVDRELPQAHRAAQVIGIGGTVSTAVAVELGIAQYDRGALHHFRLTRDAAEDVFRTMATESRADRVWNPGLAPGRVDTIVGGMAILVKIMRHFDLDHLLASESDLLDGLVRSMR